jgi:MFS transporter, DHA2 family, multidrug resistance protein
VVAQPTPADAAVTTRAAGPESSDGQQATAWRPSDSWLLGIVIAVINFWLFAQTLLNVIPGIQDSLGLDPTVANLAVSVTALMSGLFIVVFGGLADRLGRGPVMKIGIWLSIVGSLLIVLTPAEHGGLTATTLMAGRIVQGLSAACVMPSTLALIKTFYQGRARQRALSFWSIGSWGGSGFCSLFGGLMAVSVLGWRSIFWISIALSVLALFLVRSTPPSRAEQSGAGGRFDWGGLLTFIAAMLAINVFISQGPKIGWFSYGSLGLLVAFAVSILWFFHLETHRSSAFIDLTMFRNATFSGATLSNFLLNGAAGTLVVALGLVQRAAGWTALQSGLLTLGYLVAILATIRVGERLLQRFGPKSPMLWGTGITTIGILLTSMTFVLIGQYAVLAFIGFTLYGVGLGFYATPSTDAAMSNVPAEQAGAAAGLYKMASSLGSAFGVALSAAIYTAGTHIPAALVPHIFWGTQENVSLRFGGGLALLFNVLMCVIALISIMVAVPPTQPEHEREARPDIPASPSLGS